MKIVIFAGGLGTRMREETEFKPKPMVEVGGVPILVHLMEIFARQGFNDFVVLAGYKASYIKSYFSNLLCNLSDLRVTLSDQVQKVEYVSKKNSLTPSFPKGLCVSIMDTGEDTLTGERLLLAREEIGDERFIATYGDGLADIDLANLVQTHEQGNRAATVTVTRPNNRFGLVNISADGGVRNFQEKPVMTDFVNMGFFVFESSIFNLLRASESLEEGLLNRLATRSELTANIHNGFWQPMDTFREYQHLNALWKEGRAPWRVVSDS